MHKFSHQQVLKTCNTYSEEKNNIKCRLKYIFEGIRLRPFYDSLNGLFKKYLERASALTRSPTTENAVEYNWRFKNRPIALKRQY